MKYPIEKKLVVGISSNALFDLTKEDEIFQKEGLEAYREYQIKKRDVLLPKGAAFPFVERFLNINKVYSDEHPVEVVLLSRNSPETGIRIYNSIQRYGLDIQRAVFTAGESPYPYIPAFNISLFLSTNGEDVRSALEAGFAAGKILKTNVGEDDNSKELRLAFDFDGVLADDEAEKVYKEKGLEEYRRYETEHRSIALKPGPLADFFKKISYFQKLESEKLEEDPHYTKVLKTAIITARSAPAHERAFHTLEEWGVSVDEMFLLGGVEKKRVLEIMKPHLFFDDQLINLDESMQSIPLVHIPFGVANNE